MVQDKCTLRTFHQYDFTEKIGEFVGPGRFDKTHRKKEFDAFYSATCNCKIPKCKAKEELRTVEVKYIFTVSTT